MSDSQERCRTGGASCGGAAGAIYGFALLGAAVYYIQQATGFWQGVLGVLKAIIWPALVMYKVLELLKM